MGTLSTIGAFWSFIFWTLLLITVTYFAIYYLIYTRPINRWKKSNIPYLKPAFMIGHKYFLDLANYSIVVPMERLYKENSDKPLFGFFLGPLPMICLRDQKLIQQFFVKNSKQTFGTLVATPEYELEAGYMVNTTNNEERWRSGRNALTPVFSPNWFQGARFDRINETAHGLLSKIKSKDCQINVKEIIEDSVLNIMSLSFGSESDPHVKEGLGEIVDDAFEPSVRKALSLASLMYVPFFQRFEYFKGVTRKTCKIMSEIIKQQVKLRDQMATEKGDMIDILRSLRGDNTNADMTLNKLTGTSLVVVLTGIDTVSVALTWAIHALSLYPEHQRKIRKEVQDTMKKHGVSDLTYEVVRDLDFTLKCLFEVVRMFPPGQMIIRECLEDFQIPGTNFTFKKGDRVIYPSCAIGYDPTIYKDPHLFDPERYDFKNSNLNSPLKYPSFGIGPRKCPGYKHGLIVGASILASIILKYDMKPNSHKKLMGTTDFNPKGLTNAPREKLIVDLVPSEN